MATRVAAQTCNDIGRRWSEFVPILNIGGIRIVGTEKEAGDDAVSPARRQDLQPARARKAAQAGAQTTSRSFTARIEDAVSPPWTNVPATPLGAVPAGRGTPDKYVLVANAGTAIRRFDVYLSSDEHNFRESVLLFDEAIAIGCGEHTFIARIVGGEPRTVRLRSYFSEFHRATDAVYVVSGEDVTRLDLSGAVVWTSPPIGVDGVIVESIGPDFISGVGEYDPPGDWRPFRIRVNDGTLV